MLLLLVVEGGVGLQLNMGGWRAHTPNHASAVRAKRKRVGGNETQEETSRWRLGRGAGKGSDRMDPLRLPAPVKNREEGLHTAARGRGAHV